MDNLIVRLLQILAMLLLVYSCAVRWSELSDEEKQKQKTKYSVIVMLIITCIVIFVYAIF